MDRIICNADLHLHGIYSGATSKNMVPRTIAEQAPLKGLDLVGTADILNPKWIKIIKSELKESKDAVGLLEYDNGTKFILQTEVEDNKRVHHIIFFPSFSKVYEVREAFKNKSKDIDTEGRPKIWLSGEEIAEICIEAECLIGPAHAFTPWTAIFKEYNSIQQCYGSYASKIYFLELGLSADTNMADRISELHRLVFLSNSDGHSPWPNKLGREFNRFLLDEISYDAIVSALMERKNNKVILNVGLNPLEGKYHRTRCIGCLEFFSLDKAKQLRWKCPLCGKSIKKGVADRVKELADLAPGKHPEFRPEYKYIIPLSEIIALALNIESTYSKKVNEIWKRYIKKFDNEIKVLLEIEIKELSKINERIAYCIDLFRKGKIKYIPGGGGVYGKPIIQDQKNDKKHAQKRVHEFF
mgnify:CR=1 FL=1